MHFFGGGFAETLPLARVAEEAVAVRGQRLHVARRIQQPGFLVPHNLRDLPDCRCNNGNAAPHVFKEFEW